MKLIENGKITMEAAPAAIKEIILSRSSFEPCSRVEEGDEIFCIPVEPTTEEKDDLIKNIAGLQQEYLKNQLKDQKVGRFMTITYKMVEKPKGDEKGYIRLVQRVVCPGLEYSKMKYTNPKGNDLPSPKQAWDNDFTMNLKSGEKRSVFINVYDSATTKTPEHLKGVQLRLAVAYDRDHNPIKPKTTYFNLDGSPMSEERIAKIRSSGSHGYIDSVFVIYIDKILELKNNIKGE